MTYHVKMQQARAAALGFWPGPIDGIHGRRTQAAIAAAAQAQGAKGLPFIHATGLTQIRWHWTGGTYKPNATDQEHYHYIIDGDANCEQYHDVRKVLAHTLNANVGAIAIAVAAMHEAVERPFSPGPFPLLSRQLAALVRLSASLSRAYDIPVSQWSMNSHSEVQPLFGIRQRWKWDINWLPDLTAPGEPRVVNDRIRKMVERDLRSMA